MRHINVCRTIAVLCLVSVVLCWTGPVRADRVWVVTQAFDPNGDVARSTVKVVIPEYEAVVPESFRLSRDMIGSLTYTEDGELLIASALDMSMAPPVVSAAWTNPPLPTSEYELSADGEQWISNLLLTEAELAGFAEQVVVVPRTFATEIGGQTEVSGELLLLPVRGDQVGPTYSWEEPVSIPLTASAGLVAPVDRDLYNAVVAFQWDTPAQLSVVEINLDQQTIANVPLMLNSTNVSWSPVCIQKIPGRNEYVLVNLAYDSVTFEPLTEVWVVSFETGAAELLNPLDRPFEMAGWPDMPADLPGSVEISAAGSIALVATRDSSSETGRIGVLDLINIQMDSRIPIPEVRENFIVRLSPSGNRVFMGADNVFRVASAGAPEVFERELRFFQTVNDIALSEDGSTAYVASGSEIYLYDTSTAPYHVGQLSMVTLPTGVVTALGVLPPVAGMFDDDSDGLSNSDEFGVYYTNADDPDTDDDGISDGVDFSVFFPSPALELDTHSITMTAVEGRANPPSRSVWITNRGGDELIWTAYVTDVDWLDVNPPASVAPEAVVISADTAGLTASDIPYIGHVQIAGTGSVNDSPQQIEVKLYVREAPMCEAHFVASATGELAPLSAFNDLTNNGYALFANMLIPEDLNGNGRLDPGEDNNANGELDEGYCQSFDEFAMMLPLEESDFDLVQPVIFTGLPWPVWTVDGSTVQDYIWSGGTVLLMPGVPFSNTDAAQLNAWLAPMGIQIVPNVGYSLGITDFVDHPLTEGVGYVEVNNSSALTVTGNATALAWLDREQGHAALAAAFYGAGRIVVFADEEAFTNTRIGYYDHRRLAQNMFAWLSPGGAADSDTDGDGVLDRLEDANGNGLVDPGETDPLNPDSDGDLLPDGREDLDGDGLLDAGETDPTSVDTDGDGLSDGTDQFPLAWPTPFISAIDPAEGSSIGGDDIALFGMYLPENATVLFGGEPSPAVSFLGSEMLVAVSPPGTGGTTVDITVIDNTTGISERFDNAFTYILAPRVELDVGKAVTKKVLNDQSGEMEYLPANVSIELTSFDNPAASTVEMVIHYDTLRLNLQNIVVGDAAASVGKVVEWNVDEQEQTVHLTVHKPAQGPGPDDTVIPDSDILELQFTVPSFVRRGMRLRLDCTYGRVVDIYGGEIETTCDDGVVVMMIDPDVNGDGFVDATDLQLVINGALGITGVPGRADVNEDTYVDAMDVQLMINALLGVDVI